MIPKIEFRYSDVYDRNYRNSKFIQNYLEEKNQKYPSKKEILNYIKKAENIWEEKREKILKEISKISGFEWKEKRIICYVVGVGRPFSDPLTIRTYGRNINRFIETLTHELIHQIFIQNKKEYSKWNNFVLRKYEKEERLTKSHILLSAIHWKLLEKLRGKIAIEKEIKKYKDSPDYKISWEIVKKEGAEKIIKKFKEITK
ncbi:hypothetical protein J4474_01965 [Candidatus Pacearchaeota archaeon]|nr:hypothetical protein [Candidatus Pacearchaeota archaeon]